VDQPRLRNRNPLYDRERLTMTPDQFRACLDSLRWTQRGLASALLCDERMVRRWGTGAMNIPAPIAVWLTRLANAHDANPVPDWRTRAR